MSGPVYTYTLCTPDAASPMNQTTQLIQDNFQAINELVQVDHVEFNTENSGKHNQVTMQFQSEDPETSVTDLSLYVKATGSPNAAEIFYRYPNSGSVEQLTPVASTGGGGTISATSGTGWCQFPSGIIMRWGTAVVSSDDTFVIYPTGDGIPAYQQYVAYIQATLNTESSPTPSSSFPNSLTNIVITNYSGLTNFSVLTLTTAVGVEWTMSINYLAIGI